MLQCILLFIFLILFVYYLSKWSSQYKNFFKDQGVKFVNPFPFIGANTWIFNSRSFAEFYQEMHNSFPNEKIFGIFDFREPVYVLRDPQLIKQMVVKDFDHFNERRQFITSDNDEILGNMILLLRGQRWHRMRTSLSPVFTSSKMKLMFELVSNYAKQMSDFLQNEYEEKGMQHYDVKEIFSRVTNDIIATCAFGIKCDSLKDRNNEFFQIGQEFVNFQKPSQIFRFFALQFLPKLSKLLDITIINRKTRKLFREMIVETMETREKEGIVRNDLLQMIMELKRGTLKHSKDVSEKTEIAAVDEVETNHNLKNDIVSWTDDEIVAQCFIFFLAGFDTSSTAMAFTAYELAMNPEVQRKLSEEVTEVSKKLNGQLLTYDALQEMKYMDLVITETLRKWPPVPLFERQCSKAYHYDDKHKLKFTVKKDQFIQTSMFAMHRDPKYFPNPEKFDPERFIQERADLNAYFPFGVGPKNCIGSRFALMQTKAVIYYLVEAFKIEIGPESKVPVKLVKGIPGLVTKNKIELLFTPKSR